MLRSVAEPTDSVGQARRVSRFFIAYQEKTLKHWHDNPRQGLHPRSPPAREATWDGRFSVPQKSPSPKPTAAPHSTHRQDRPRARTDSAGSVMSTAPFPIRFRMLVSVIGLPSSTDGQCSRLGYALSPFCYSYRLVGRGGNGWSRSSNSPRGPLAGPAQSSALTRASVWVLRINESYIAFISTPKGTRELSVLGWQIKPRKPCGGGEGRPQR